MLLFRCLTTVLFVLVTTKTAFAVDEAVGLAADREQQVETESTYTLPNTVTYEGQVYPLTGKPLNTAQMKLMMPGVTWVYYREDGTTQWEYHTFDGYVLCGMKTAPWWSPGRGRLSTSGFAGPTTALFAAGSGRRSVGICSPFRWAPTSR